MLNSKETTKALLAIFSMFFHILICFRLNNVYTSLLHNDKRMMCVHASCNMSIDYVF